MQAQGDPVKPAPIFLMIIPALLFFVSPSYAEKGTVTLRATQENSSVSGQADLEDTPAGLKITAKVLHASPGSHAIHIHEFPDCGDSGKAAGSHFNPEGAPHGFFAKDGPAQAHIGDLGNIEIFPDGTGNLEVVLPGVGLKDGKYAVAGRSLVLHEKVDDFSQPAGNAGSRIGCGEIILNPAQAGQ